MKLSLKTLGYIVLTFIFINSAKAEDIIYTHTNTAGRSTKEALDILVVGTRFDNGTQLKKYADMTAKKLKTFDFFKDNQDKYNVKYLTNILDYTEYNCHMKGCLNIDAIDKLKSKYESDVVVVIVKSNEYSGYSATADSNWPNYLPAAHITSNWLDTYGANVVVHELGHSLGNLFDEYVYPNDENSPYKRESVNCKKDPKDLNSSTYYKGCSWSEYYRATNNSIMRDTLSNYFDATAKNQLSRMFEKYAPKIPEYTPATPVLKFNDTTLNIKWNDEYWHWIEVGNSKGASNIYRHNTTIDPSKGSLDINLKNKVTKGSTVYVKFWTWNDRKSIWTNVDYSVKFDQATQNPVPDDQDAPNPTGITSSFKYDNGYMRNLPSYEAGSKLIRRSAKSMTINIIGRDRQNYWVKYTYAGTTYWSAKWLTNLSTTDFYKLKVVN